MGEEPLEPRRRRGGRPPEIDEEALRGRYGQPGVDLVVLLYRLASEAGFTALDAARRWAALDPEDARAHGVLKDSGVARQRLTETMQMVKGAVPVGLIKAFLDLWTTALPDGDASARARRVADRITALRRKVVAAYERPTPAAARPSRSSGAVSKARIDRLKDELLVVQQELIRTQQSEVQFRNLSGFLFIALTRLQDTRSRLVRERDDLRARAEATEALDRDARTAGDQLARAQRQLEQAQARTAEAEQLAEDLRARYSELSARLAELETPDTGPAMPPSATLAPPGTDTLPGAGSLADNDVVLDRVEDLLTEGGQDLAQTRDRLAHDDEPVWPDSDKPTDLGVVLPQPTPDNPPTWPSGPDYPEPAADAQPATTGDDAGEETSSAGPEAWPPWSGPDLVQGTAHLDPESRRSAARALRQRAHDRYYTVGEAALLRKVDLIRSARLDPPFRIAVVSLKGGVGRTAITLCLGTLLAELREERVIAVDLDLTHGNLAHRLPLETTATVRHLLRDAHRLTTYEQVRDYTSQSPSAPLEVLASEPDPAVAEAFTAADYLDTLDLLERFYGILIADCGTNLTHPSMTAVLKQADALVVVSSCSIDGAQISAHTLDRLEAFGHGDLVARSVAVINMTTDPVRVDVDKLDAHFAQRCRAVVRVPPDPHLAQGTVIEAPGRLAPKTRAAILDLASAVVDAFPAARRHHTPSPDDNQDRTLAPDRRPAAEPPAPSTPPGPPQVDEDAPSPEPARDRWWSELLSKLDLQLASGGLTADEYRYRRDEILAAAFSRAPRATRQEALDLILGRMNRKEITPAQYERDARWIIDNPRLYPPEP